MPPYPVSGCPACGFHVDMLRPRLDGAPEREDTVVDSAGVMSEEGRRRIAARIHTFTRPTGHDAVVVTVAATAPLTPSEYAVGLFERWRVGGERRDGLMLLVAVAEARVECVLGPALAPALPDEASDGLLRRHAVPHLVRGDIEGGVLHGFEMLARVFEHVQGLR